MVFWLAPQPLVLASRSDVRRSLLAAAAIPIETVPANIDERALESGTSGDAGQVAIFLAQEKAKSVSARMPGRIVLGADQTLVLGSQRFTKPAGRDAAREQLCALRGRTHALHSAAAIVCDGHVRFARVEMARLTMRPFSDKFLESYLDQAGPAIVQSVGGYQIESVGIHLFERIEGDHATILGLPLQPLLAWMRGEGLLAQ